MGGDGASGIGDVNYFGRAGGSDELPRRIPGVCDCAFTVVGAVHNEDLTGSVVSGSHLLAIVVLARLELEL